METHTLNRRSKPLLLASSAVAALLLTLGVNGTLASWTQAVLTNDTNTVATAAAVILQESSGASTCTSSSSATNAATCSSINKYGGTSSPLTPGANQVTNVTFTNTGSAPGASFALAPGTCTQTPVAGSGTPPAANGCTNGDLTVAVSCSPGATFNAGSAWTDLVYAAGAPPTTTRTHAAAGGDLNAAAQWTCRITVALASGAGPTNQGITVSQPLTWTLTQ